MFFSGAGGVRVTKFWGIGFPQKGPPVNPERPDLFNINFQSLKTSIDWKCKWLVKFKYQHLSVHQDLRHIFCWTGYTDSNIITERPLWSTPLLQRLQKRATPSQTTRSVVDNICWFNVWTGALSQRRFISCLLVSYAPSFLFYVCTGSAMFVWDCSVLREWHKQLLCDIM